MTDKRESGSDKMKDEKIDIAKKTSKQPPQEPPREKSEPTSVSIPEGSEQATNANDISTETIDKKDPTRYGDWVKNGRCIDF